MPKKKGRKKKPRCLYHSNTIAIYRCQTCDEFFCQECYDQCMGECPDCDPPQLNSITAEDLEDFNEYN